MLLSLLGSSGAHAQNLLRLDNGKEVELSADSIVCNQTVCVFDGDVSLMSETQVMFADKLTVTIKEKEDGSRAPSGGMAEGGVLIIDGNVVTACDKVMLNDDMVTGSLSLAEIRVKKLPAEKVPHAWSAMGTGKNSLLMTGQNIERTGPTSFHIKNAYFTPCDCGENNRPTYSITAQDAWVELGSHANFYKPRIQPLDVALPGLPFSLPFIHVPISKRKTGILPPGFRFSPQENFYLEGGFFWATSPTVDMTFNVGWSERRGVREGYELRYNPTQTTKGQLNLIHLHDELYLKDRRAAGENTLFGAERLSLTYSHNSDVRGRNPLRLNLALISDGYYLSDQGFTVAAQATQYLPSRLVYERREDDWRAAAGVQMFQDFLATRDVTSPAFGRTPQRVPELGFFLAPKQLPYGFNVSFEARAAATNRFIKERGVSFVREAAPDGTLLDAGRFVTCAIGDGACEQRRFAGRLEVLPRLSRPLFFGPIQVLPEISGLMSVHGDSVTERATARGWLAGRVDVRSTMGRMFSFNDGVTYRHRVMPLVRWALIPAVWRETAARAFDERDLVSALHQTSLGFETDLFRKASPKAPARKLLALSALQHFNLGGPSQAIPAAVGELVLGFRFSVAPWLDVSGRGSHNWQENRFRELGASLDLKDPRVGRMSLSYQRIIGGGSARINTGLFELSPSGAVPVNATLGRYHSAGVNLSTERIGWFKASYSTEILIALNPKERTFALQHLATLQYDSPCDCFGVGVIATIPTNVFNTVQQGTQKVSIGPTFSVYLTIGDTKFGVNN